MYYVFKMIAIIANNKAYRSKVFRNILHFSLILRDIIRYEILILSYIPCELNSNDSSKEDIRNRNVYDICMYNKIAAKIKKEREKRKLII